MLDIIDVHKSYANTPVLRGVNLSVARGEVVVLMGPSGCGKSTLIRCVNRLIEPDGGDIRIQGESILAMSPERLRVLRSRIGFVFQHFNLIARLTAWQNVALGMVMSGVDRDLARESALDALQNVGLRELADRLPSEMSGGQQQRVGIARALLTQPDLMLWDEPTASLDPIRVQEVLEAMENLVAESQAAMLIVTHEIPFALRMAHRIVLMDQGKIVEEGDPWQVLTDPRSDIGEQYARLARLRNAPLSPDGRRSAPNEESRLRLGVNAPEGARAGKACSDVR